MPLMEWVLLLLVAVIIGSLAQAPSGFSAAGFLVSITLAFIGAVLGAWLFGALNLPEIYLVHFDEVQVPVVWSILVATLFVAVYGLFRPRPIP
jgi:uncharacterized membrane protein YeaQ/YmgE (transglycosylase-associated protein family)